MPLVIVWFGFVGAWLLLAGPIYQAAIELENEGLERGVIAVADRQVPPAPPTSPWWWLIPPVAYVLRRRRSRIHRDAMIKVLTPNQLEQVLSFSSKAAGWSYVAGGAFLLALKETWELVEAYEGPILVWVGLIVVMPLGAAANTVLRMRRTQDLVRLNSEHEDQGSEQG